METLYAIKDGIFGFCTFVHQLTFWPKYGRDWTRDRLRPFLSWLPKWITPNRISYFRAILSVPIGYCLANRMIDLAFLLYLIACITDFLDGALADVREQHTRWGKILDPIADKILQITSFTVIMLIFFPDAIIFIWALAINISIDLATALAAWVMLRGKENISGANRYGKIKFGCQCASVFLIMLNSLKLAFLSLVLACIMGICSAIKHLQK